MKTKNKCLPCLILDGNQYIFNCLNVDPVRKNDDERVHCSFGENTVQFVLYLDGILDEDCVINKDGVIELFNIALTTAGGSSIGNSRS